MHKAEKAKFWQPLDGEFVRCELCPHFCKVAESMVGSCSVRFNQEGELYSYGYGVISEMSLDPIEKKPLYHFESGNKILSIGGFGCNMDCQFCQNYDISMANVPTGRPLVTPKDILKLAVEYKVEQNIGVAYSYNEPLVGYEFVYDCSKLIFDAGLKNVLVTNGLINPKPLSVLLPLISAMNIDLKGFTQEYYDKLDGNLETVKNTIVTAYKACHIEITVLVVPEENENDIEPIAKWLSEIDPDIPLHISRFFPRYKCSDKQPTSLELMDEAAAAAKKYLNRVYTGNMYKSRPE